MKLGSTYAKKQQGFTVEQKPNMNLHYYVFTEFPPRDWDYKQKFYIWDISGPFQLE